MGRMKYADWTNKNLKTALIAKVTRDSGQTSVMIWGYSVTVPVMHHM